MKKLYLFPLSFLVALSISPETQATINASYNRGIENSTKITWKDINSEGFPVQCEGVTMPTVIKPYTHFFQTSNAITFDKTKYSPYMGQWCHATYQNEVDGTKIVTISVRLNSINGFFEVKTSNTFATAQTYGADINPLPQYKL